MPLESQTPGSAQVQPAGWGSGGGSIPRKPWLKRFIATTLIELAIVLGVSLLARLYGYLLFHSTAELFCVFVASAIFAIAWNCRSYMDNRYLLFVGIGYLFVGICDLLHTLSYRGMGVFIDQRGDLSIQLWIVGRFIEAATILIAILLMNRRWRPSIALGACLAVTASLLTLIFSGRFPLCFIEEGHGIGQLTPFKVISEYVICAILATSMVLIFRRRGAFDPLVLRFLFISLGLTILSELTLTLYENFYGFANLVGHLFKLAAYYLIYKAVIRTGLRRPYATIFRNLVQSQVALRDANTQLVHRSRDLELANEELEAFARTVAHDLQNPLAAMRGFAWVLNQDLDSSDLDSARQSAAKIRSINERMGVMVKNLLNLSRVRHAELRRERLDLAEIAREVAGELRQRDPEREADFVIPEALEAEGDPALLQIVMENLFSNAWKFSQPRERARIEVGMADGASGPDGPDSGDGNGRPRGNEKIFFVRDNGIGFDMAHAGEIFQTFKRLPGSEDYAGTGIGLASVRRIIERHGGRVWAESQPGEGAVFFLFAGKRSGKR